MIGSVRTPGDRFAGLPDFPFEPRYEDWEGLRLHRIDEGAGRPVVLFHGEPTWSFLWRTVAAVLLEAGHRVVAVDMPGFGRSDKPTDPAFYTYDRLVAAVGSILSDAGVAGATAVVQDWGGPIGLRLAVERPGMFDRISVLNTGLSTGTGRVSRGFAEWRAFVESHPDLPVGRIMRASMVRPWPDEVVAGYEAPFPDATAKAGVAALPLIVPIEADDPGAAEMARVLASLEHWDRPAQVLFSTQDPIFPVRVGARLADRIPGAGGLETVEDAGHFLQEDAGETVGRKIAAFLARTG